MALTRPKRSTITSVENHASAKRDRRRAQRPIIRRHAEALFDLVVSGRIVGERHRNGDGLLAEILK